MEQEYCCALLCQLEDFVTLRNKGQSPSWLGFGRRHLNRLSYSDDVRLRCRDLTRLKIRSTGFSIKTLSASYNLKSEVKVVS